MRFASGEYIEVHKPLNEHERWLRVGYEAHRPIQIAPAEDSRGVRRKGYRRDRFRQRVSQFFYEDRVEPVTPAELAAAQSHGAHDAITQAPDVAQVESRPVGGGQHLVAPISQVTPDERNL